MLIYRETESIYMYIAYKGLRNIPIWKKNVDIIDTSTCSTCIDKTTVQNFIKVNYKGSIKLSNQLHIYS